MKKGCALVIALCFISLKGRAQQWTVYDTATHYIPANLVVQLDSNRFLSLISVRAYSYDPDSGSKELTSFNIPIRYSIDQHGSQGTLLSNGQVLFTGDSAALYDPQLDVLTKVNGLGQGRLFHSAVRLQNGQVLIAGGKGNRGPDFTWEVFNSCELYDPSSQSWQQAASLPVGRAFSASILLNGGKVLLTGGYDSIGNPVKEAMLYDPLNNSWTSANDLHTPSCFHSLVKLNTGEVLLFGGLGPGGALNRVEKYDPINNTWSLAGNMLEHRFGHTATQMPDGSIIVVAGANAVPLKSVERFDPQTNSSALIAPLHEARSEHQAFLIKNGGLIVIGGKNETIFNFSSIRANYTEVFR